MDDLSNVTTNADETASGVTMYLSFDADCTLSNSAFKTLENTIEQDENKNPAEISPTMNHHANKTLESDNILLDDGNVNGSGRVGSFNKNNVNCVNDNGIIGGGQLNVYKALQKMKIGMKPITPVRVLQKNILKDFNNMSSTPTNQQIKNKLDVSHIGIPKIVVENYDATDLSTAFNYMEAVQPLKQHDIVVAFVEEHKEDPLQDVDTSSASTLSISSMVEQKLAMLSLTENQSSVVELKTDHKMEMVCDENAKKQNKSIQINDFCTENGKNLQQSNEEVIALGKKNVKQMNLSKQNELLAEKAVEQPKNIKKATTPAKDQDKENKKHVKSDKVAEKKLQSTNANKKQDNLVKRQSFDENKQKPIDKATAALEKNHENPVLAGAAKNVAISVQSKTDAAAVSAPVPKVKFDLATVVKVVTDNITKDLQKITASKIVPNNEDNAATKQQPIKVLNVEPKIRRSLLPAKNVVKSVCEPNLQTNRPSRIANKRVSLMPLLPLKSTTEQQTKISDLPLKKSAEKPITKIPDDIQTKKLVANDDKKQPINSIKVSEMPLHSKPIAQQDKSKSIPVPTARITKRSTLLPSTMQHLKPSLKSNVRRSVLYTNASNSPARKILRRSIITANASPAEKSRRSILPRTIAAANVATRRSVAQFQKPLMVSPVKEVVSKKRKSLHPTASFRGFATNTTTNATNTQKSHPPLTATLSAPAHMQTVNVATGGGAIKKEKTFTCVICFAKFRIKSLLDAHKRSHEDILPNVVTKKSTTTATTTSANVNNISNSHQCKFCDKKFVLLRALHIHLMVNCPKIPPKEKRKLDFTEMDHVEKAQLPQFVNNVNTNGNSTNANSSSSSLLSLVSSIGAQQQDSLLMKKLLTPILTNAAASEDESLIDKTEITIIANDLSILLDKSMAPPTTNKIKRSKIPGAIKTPKKTIKCHLCNERFINVLDYTDHSMTTHLTDATATATATATANGVGNIEENSLAAKEINANAKNANCQLVKEEEEEFIGDDKVHKK